MKKLDTTYDACYDCNLKLGGIVPKSPHGGITVYSGVCEYCNKEKTLVPHNDFDWPKEKRKAWFD